MKRGQTNIIPEQNSRDVKVYKKKKKPTSYYILKNIVTWNGAKNIKLLCFTL